MLFIISLILSALTNNIAPPAPITGVTIRDDNFEVIKVLGKDELADFLRHWHSKQQVKKSLIDAGGKRFWINIQRGEKSVRWEYRSDGCVQLLSKKQFPVYELQDPAAFNKIIGAEK